MSSTDIQPNVTADEVEAPTTVPTTAAAPTKKRKKSKKQEFDEDGNPIKKKRNTRSNRYPLVKRKCRTAYQIYITNMAQRNKEDGGGPKTAADYAAAWRSETDKGRWYELAKQDLQEYIKEVRAHGYTYEDKKSNNNRDKKPSGAFLLYARDHHKQLQKEMNIKYAESLTILGTRWTNGEIDPDLKQKYVDQANEEKRIYSERKASKEQANSN